MSDKNRSWASTLGAASVGALLFGGIGYLLYEFLSERKSKEQPHKQVSLRDLRDDSEDSALQSNSSCYNTCAASTLSSREDDFMTAVGSLTSCDEVEDHAGDVASVSEKILSIEDFKVEDLEKMLDGSYRDLVKSKGVILDRHEEDPEDPDILWLMAKLCHMKGEAKEGEAKVPFYISGGEFADKALARANGRTKGNAHKWKAICAGSEGLLGDVHHRVQKALIFKEHILEALKLLPEDEILHHLLGIFYYELANLGFIEKMACSAIGLSSDYDSALKHLLKAKDFSEEFPWKGNWFYIGKCYIGLQNKSRARCALQKAAAAPMKTGKDVKMQADILAELAELNK